MNSTGNKRLTKEVQPYHWTLLLYGIKEETWKHYNSLTKKKDPYLADAITVFKLTDKPNFRLSSSPIVFEAQMFNAPIISAEKAPQQLATSVDCGIVVCHIISELASQRQVPISMNQDDVQKFRVHLVSRFFNDGERSWTLKDWQSFQVMKDEQQIEDVKKQTLHDVVCIG
ncbi:hypothetical protein Vadar_013353 [Vaccinium darrowii]|uniref:Uncharacterized protein n=1 Tax=Vaccinium darrowii TaxID=229202 RepID=A0ACB7Z545_9ERIC|nr:hypothetical protein Vadar_013353 [Vaccinium darrowii]